LSAEIPDEYQVSKTIKMAVDQIMTFDWPDNSNLIIKHSLRFLLVSSRVFMPYPNRPGQMFRIEFKYVSCSKCSAFNLNNMSKCKKSCGLNYEYFYLLYIHTW
jgi:hypothetical protein